MIDPIGGFRRILDFFISYVETSFRISNPGVAKARLDLLNTQGVLAAEPFIEPVLRYEEASKPLEGYIDDPALSPLSARGREAFIDLALSGLFTGEDAPAGGRLRRKSIYAPYKHQVDMLMKGIRAGEPAIVTSGTGSGKTESFMLPVLAELANEAVRWAQPNVGYLSGKWWEQGQPYLPRREYETRPAAVRALILYPMNALVADQMVRLRRTLDSAEAAAVMRDRFNGNRIFFGQYNGETPVTGHQTHPRLAKEKEEKERNRRRHADLRAEMRAIAESQQMARGFDEARLIEDPGHDLTRYIFPSVDGGEMVSRWDMQKHAPDIFVTNPSMLGAMLSREVEDSIFDQTRTWLEANDDAKFFLVFDELHLMRGSPGTETSFLIKALLTRLGLDQPEHRHKLRVLASSASLPLDDARASQSLGYLRDLLAPFGTFKHATDAGSTDPEFWRSGIVEGSPVLPSSQASKHLDPKPFEDLVKKAAGTSSFAVSLNDVDIDGEAKAIAAMLSVDASLPPVEMLTSIAEAAADRLSAACVPHHGKPRATALGSVSRTIFGTESADAVRGLMLARALPEARKGVRKVKAGTPSFRVHTFIRNIEGLFGSLRPTTDGAAVIEGLTIERGLSHSTSIDGTRGRRLFELLYCQACGELYVGGQRGRSGAHGKQFELLPSNPDLDRIPDASASVSYDNMTWDEFAVFWPSRAVPKEAEMDYDQWDDAVLDTATGVVSIGAAPTQNCVTGRAYFQKDAAVKKGSKEPKTAQPFCCPKCGTDYSPRPQHLLRSPIRAFRTGFTKASQLVATELFELLHAAGDEAKTIVFSDSRQDAANQALEIERLHMRDLKREILIDVVGTYLLELESRSVPQAQQPQIIMDLMSQGRSQEASDLLKEWNSPEIDLANRKIQFETLLRLEGRNAGISRFVAELVRLGIHPSDETGRRRFGKRPWFECFEIEKGQVAFDKSLGSTRDEVLSDVNQNQYSLIIDTVFANSFFALEETGLGYPSMDRGAGPEVDKLDAWLRVFASAYRIREGDFFKEDARPWSTASNVTHKRIKRYAGAVFGGAWDAGLTDVLARFKNLGHVGGIIAVGKLYLRLSRPDDPFWRCQSCERVHLHFGTGRCTRCNEAMNVQPSGQAQELWRSNFLGRRIVRGQDEKVPRFRLTCEELTGQTDDFADRLRRFKGIFVGDMSPIERAARDIDMLSVTTTMEVGIDIGSLNSVYQANMPPQRFNYQQRVGRAGRRGQAFSFVNTFCRGRTHDEHYFRNPAAITGDPPPAPFLAVEHLPIPERLTRKIWLRAAFNLLRKECVANGEPYPGDALNPPDIHGEYVSTEDFYTPGSVWPDRLVKALASTIGERDRFVDAAVITGVPAGADAQIIKTMMKPDVLVQQILDAAQGEVPSYRGLGHFLAEAGLLPMYGMPTSVRDLYTGVERAAGARYGAHDEFSWSTMDRDLDLAISEYSPGKVLVKDKRKHLVIGFTGPLMDPSRHGHSVVLQKPLTTWFTDERYIAKCACGAAKEKSVADNQDLNCDDCSEVIPAKTFRRFVTPAGFRTDFGIKDHDEQFVKQSLATVATVLHEGQANVVANVKLHHGAGITIMRLNEGCEGENDQGIGFDITDVIDNGVYVTGPKERKSLPDQGIVLDSFKPEPGRWTPTGGTATGVGLVSRKQTDAIYLETLKFDARLGLDLVARRGDHSHLGARSAAISATHMLVQQAALLLDVAPEEFEALEPRRRDGKPVLQIADTLVNGSGLCRALSVTTPSTPKPGIIEMVEKIIYDETDDPLRSLIAASHASKCQTACYRCIQQYGNRRYHGLLDWRLGLSYLRSLIDSGFACGLDGDFQSAPELRDWRSTAEALAEELVAMRPSSLSLVLNVGPYALPMVEDTRGSGAGTRTLIVHPLWRLDADADARLFGTPDVARHRFLNTFELPRRPLKALEAAQKQFKPYTSP